MMKKLLTLIFATVALTTPLAARDFEFEGIFYTVLDEDAKTCQTTAGVWWTMMEHGIDQYVPGNPYGNSEQTIPATVTDGNVVYTVTAIGNGSFYGNSSIRKLELPGTLTSIGDSAFFDCRLEEIHIPASVEKIGKRAFGGDPQRQGIPAFSVDVNNKHYSSNNNILYNKDKTTLIAALCGNREIDIPASVTKIGDYSFCGYFQEHIKLGQSVTEIGEGAFSGSNITTIDIPNSVTRIENATFANCNNLSSIDIPNSVVEIGERVFSSCYNLTNVKLGESVTTIGDNAFLYCQCLSSITLPNSLTALGASAFNGCNSLTDIELSTGLTTINDWVFGGCRSLTDISIPGTVTTIGESAFNGCSGLAHIEIPNSVTAIGEAAFDGCVALAGVKLPNTITLISRSTFGGCESLSAIEIPNSVTRIGKFAFADCKGLTSIVIPASVSVVEDSAFGIDNGESALTDITLPASLAELGEYVFSGHDNIKNVYYAADEPIRAYFNSFSEKCYNNATLHVSAVGLENISTKRIVPWSLFANVEQSGIEEVEADGTAADGEVYTLQGVKAVEPLKPGLYIVNGHKTIVK